MAHWKLFGKILVTVVIAGTMLLWIMRDVRKLQEKFPGNALLEHLVVEQDKAKEKARLVTLNQFLPHNYENLIRLANGEPEITSPDDLPAYIRYYEKVVEYMPQLPEGPGLLAFCYYYAGKKDEAAALYEKAAAMNPHAVWYHYNLGVIHYRDGRYPAAIGAFQKALSTDLNLSVKFILSSKLYQDILRERELGAQDIESGIEEILKRSRMLIAFASFHLKGVSVETPLEEDLNLSIF